MYHYVKPVLFPDCITTRVPWLVCFWCLLFKAIRGLIRLQGASSLHRLAGLRFRLRSLCANSTKLGGGGLHYTSLCQCPTLTE